MRKTNKGNIDGIKHGTKGLRAMNLNCTHIIDLWFAYEDIRQSGAYNMITDGEEVAEKLNLTIEQYGKLVSEYGRIKKQVLLLTSVADSVLF